MPANGDWTWQANTQYTVSIEARSSDGAKIRFNPVGGNVSQSSAISTTSEWKRYSYTFTTGSSPTTGSMTYGVDQTSGVTMEFRRPKIELGSVATPWIPNPSDDQYVGSTLGFNELGDTPSVSDSGHVLATEYIEW